MCDSLSRRLSAEDFLLLGSVSGNGVRTVDLPRQSARYRSVPAFDAGQALSHRFSADLEQSLYALDSTTIDLCVALFPWARFRQHKAAVKMHTLLDLHGNIPTFIRVTSGAVHDVNVLDEIMPEAGAFYVMDRAYIDFQRLFVFTLSSAFFVVRTKSNVLLERRYSHPVDKSTGVLSDQTV